MASYDQSKYSKKHYDKNRINRIVSKQIAYHKKCIISTRNYHPFEDGHWINFKTFTTFDIYPPSLYQNLWTNPLGHYFPSYDQLKENIDYVLELQRVKRIPVFIVESIESYTIIIELRKFRNKQHEDQVQQYQIDSTKLNLLIDKHRLEYADKRQELINNIYKQRTQKPTISTS